MYGSLTNQLVDVTICLPHRAGVGAISPFRIPYRLSLCWLSVQERLQEASKSIVFHICTKTRLWALQVAQAVL